MNNWRFWGRWCCGWALALLAPLGASELASSGVTVLIVAGARGAPEFESDFSFQIETWAATSAKAGARPIVVGLKPVKDGPADREQVRAVLAAEPKDGGELWVVLIGHGTFDGREAKLNLRGPDLTAAELAEWLLPFRRPLAVIDTTAASAPFMARLSGPNRVVVTATRSGHEQNYARFGKNFAAALADTRGDFDKDGQVSLLEAFLDASHRVAEFYQEAGRLATEHALIDDNGDGLGTPADWFRGVRATKRAKDGAAPDGPRAHQFHLARSAAERQLSPEVRTKRDELEGEIEVLREKKNEMDETDYLRALEDVLLKLARLYEGT